MGWDEDIYFGLTLAILVLISERRKVRSNTVTEAESKQS